MMKLHIALSELLALGAALYLMVVFMMRGQLLRRRLRSEMIRINRAGPMRLPIAA
jgi:hypothetical protein